jgi:hypothetical protein
MSNRANPRHKPGRAFQRGERGGRFVEVPQAVIRIMGPRPAQEAPGGAGQGRALSAAGSFGAALFLQAPRLTQAVSCRLGRELLAGLQIRKDHRLVTTGVCKRVRHPMRAGPPPLGDSPASPPPELDRGSLLPGGVHPPLRRADLSGGGDDGRRVRRGVSVMRR